MISIYKNNGLKISPSRNIFFLILIVKYVIFKYIVDKHYNACEQWYQREQLLENQKKVFVTFNLISQNQEHRIDHFW